MDDVKPTSPDANETRMRKQKVDAAWRKSTFSFEDEGEIQSDINTSHRMRPESAGAAHSSTVWQTVTGQVRDCCCCIVCLSVYVSCASIFVCERKTRRYLLQQTRGSHRSFRLRLFTHAYACVYVCVCVCVCVCTESRRCPKEASGARTERLSAPD